jgi:hypothetical protein
VGLWRQHHVVEILREHHRRKKHDCPQCFITDIDEIVFHRCRDNENAARSNRMLRTIFHVQFATARDDVLRFFNGIGSDFEF